MAGRYLSKAVLDSLRVPIGSAGFHSRNRIGNREIVGFGYNGGTNYVDRADCPMPAIRFKEDTADVKALREKEKGDWKKLTKEEKKALYRASFCQTFAEFQAPTGVWKYYYGWAIGIASLSLWVLMALRTFVLPPLPESLTSEASRKAQLKRMLDMQVNPIDGISSKWDYENNRWK